MPNDPFVDVAALASLGPIRYLDARDQAMFEGRHAPGAVRVPVDEWDKAAKAAGVGFDNTAYWDHALGSLGVDPARTLGTTVPSGASSFGSRPATSSRPRKRKGEMHFSCLCLGRKRHAGIAHRARS